ncbi:MAG: hypothetical protein JXJ22_08085 [Bacteroidales bacterium]|nr:hypothetical protein [Bacteroidales bacterium]
MAFIKTKRSPARRVTSFWDNPSQITGHHHKSHNSACPVQEFFCHDILKCHPIKTGTALCCHEDDAA